LGALKRDKSAAVAFECDDLAHADGKQQLARVVEIPPHLLRRVRIRAEREGILFGDHAEVLLIDLADVAPGVLALESEPVDPRL